MEIKTKKSLGQNFIFDKNLLIKISDSIKSKSINSIIEIGNESLLLTNPISAIYTPFSIILYYEIFLLIFYLPRSFTTSILKQFEINNPVIPIVSNVSVIPENDSNEIKKLLLLCRV